MIPHNSYKLYHFYALIRFKSTEYVIGMAQVGMFYGKTSKIIDEMDCL